MVSAVIARMIDGLVLACQHVGDQLGRLERVLPASVVQVPASRECGPLLDTLEAGERAHRPPLPTHALLRN
uniref:Putative secreted protein n=1 Tax=Ixodes ricinus TaxID=34613 RepID=A0A6B0TRZ3_IXORI